jgi:hypothetical protein
VVSEFQERFPIGASVKFKLRDLTVEGKVLRVGWSPWVRIEIPVGPTDEVLEVVEHVSRLERIPENEEA